MVTYTRCPKCGHQPLPSNQALPAACPGCGVILAKVSAAPERAAPEPSEWTEEPEGWWGLVTHVPQRVDALRFKVRLALLAIFSVWGLVLIRMDYRDGEIGASFLHRPLLVFHEAGHVVFMFLGDWVHVLGGTLGQLIMPLLMAGVLLVKNRDLFGAALGLWLFGVSLLDVAPYMYDALEPQLMLLSGRTGEEGGHDWIYLFSSLGWLAQAQRIGAAVHALGALVVVLSLAWAGAVLAKQSSRCEGDVLHEEDDD